MELYKEVRKSIVKKLFKKGCFGKGHMLAIRLHKSLPKQFIPYSKKTIKELTRREIILIKKIHQVEQHYH